MSRKEVVIQFFRENWKFWLSVCLAVALFITAVTVYMHKEEKRVTEPITVICKKVNTGLRSPLTGNVYSWGRLKP